MFVLRFLFSYFFFVVLAFVASPLRSYFRPFNAEEYTRNLTGGYAESCRDSLVRCKETDILPGQISTPATQFGYFADSAVPRRQSQDISSISCGAIVVIRGRKLFDWLESFL